MHVPKENKKQRRPLFIVSMILFAMVLLAVLYWILPLFYGSPKIDITTIIGVRLYATGNSTGITAFNKDELERVPSITFEEEAYLRVIRNAKWQRGRASWKMAYDVKAVFPDKASEWMILGINNGVFKIIGEAGYYRVRPEDIEEYRQFTDEVIPRTLHEARIKVNG